MNEKLELDQSFIIHEGEKCIAYNEKVTFQQSDNTNNINQEIKRYHYSTRD